jgi:hypothetical protein
VSDLQIDADGRELDAPWTGERARYPGVHTPCRNPGVILPLGII